MPEAPLYLIAMCEGVAGAERTAWSLIPPLIFLGWGLIAWICVWRDTGPDERSSLVGLLAICAAVGGLIFLVSTGISGDGGYLARFLLSVLVAAGIGAAWARLSDRIALWRGIAVAVAGDVMVPGGLVLMLFWAIALTGSCLG